MGANRISTHTDKGTMSKKTLANKRVKKPAGEKPILVQPVTPLKLDLACGQNCAEGFEGVDMWEGAKHQQNLLRFPWPWADSSVDEIHCSHFVEHIPMEFVDEHGRYVPCGTPDSKDLFFKFFDECHRILKPDGWMTVITPCARSNRAFQDPTHRRFIVAESFFYLSKAWRDANKLDHYGTSCNFDGSVNPTVFAEMNVRSAEVQQNAFQKEWNAILDWVAKLKAIK
jgi:predicted SAM-dependent methyltransferase